MPCHAAMIDKPTIIKPDTKVEKALKELQKKHLDGAPVVDENGVVVGIFSISGVMQNLLPVSVAMSNGIQLDVTVRAAPGVAKRLKKVYPLPVSDLMERKFYAVYPQTPIWEGVNMLVTHGAPIFVVENDENKFIGILDFHTALAELQRLQESEAT